MIYQDPIYGKVKIETPVILELIKSPPLQRLKGIPQLGYTSVYFPEVSHTRFEHSLGVFILLKKFGASLKEQVAGLIHDVSHTVFCHIGDYIFDAGSETKHTFQDDIFKDFVLKTEIPKILRKFNFPLNYILNEENFPLKEEPLPDLCADRIDYFLRDGFYFKKLSKGEIKEILDNFTILENRWVLKSIKVARNFARKYLLLNRLYWSSPEAGVMFKTIGEAIKYALSKGVLKEKDIFTTDKEVLEKLKKFEGKDKRFDLLLKRMQGKIKWKLDKRNYGISVKVKSRVVDPLIMTSRRDESLLHPPSERSAAKVEKKEPSLTSLRSGNQKLKRLSKIDKNWAEIIGKESKPKEYFIKFEL